MLKIMQHKRLEGLKLFEPNNYFIEWEGVT